ncbi:hypothetical protein AVDCRST_MAG81-5465 [uncultured Synechococcales cyanobacterium]|uniref:Uncharacterized protein n=1 Tax=uncultured Synechococcales cyanobacterium TaxID=1936017 RepID=A0A6J4VWK6_9CYAN|nr:hypothetical protein AVDCRST_MAG81-5465 [uncultured Synechococcales cyanobacterium]
MITTWTLEILVASVIALPDLDFGDIVGLLGLGSVALASRFKASSKTSWRVFCD